MEDSRKRGPGHSRTAILSAAIWGSVAAAVALFIAIAPGAGGPSQAAAASGMDSASGSAASSSASAAASSSAASSAAAVDDGTCVVCHTSTEALEAAGIPEGKDASMYLVYDAFLQDPIHGAISCVSCHGGDDTASTYDAAHKDLVKDPSDTDTSGVCGTEGCHADKAATFSGSFHYTAHGIYDKLCTRLSGQEDGQKNADYIFTNDCYSCHASCAQCHVSVPESNGGGLLRGHVFTRDDDQELTQKTCGWCHDAIGPSYMAKDVHYEEGMNCTQCHKSIEFHGSPLLNDTATYHDGTVANCLECHQDIVGTGAHTETHLDNAACSACHAQPYDSCFNCHENEVVTGVKLGYGDDGMIHTLVHVPVDHEMYLEDYGITLDPDTLGTKSTWVQVETHTLQPAIPNQELCNRCHGDDTLLLTEDDLQYPDMEEQEIVAPLDAVTPSAGD